MKPTPWPAKNLDVKAFHHILLWPVLMRGSSGGKNNIDQKIDPFVEAFAAAGWVEQIGPSGGVHEDFTYAEVLYFHPFVRDFLFGDGLTNAPKRTLRRFKRTDATGVTIDIKPDFYSDNGRFQFMMKVERSELLLIRPRVAILLLELSNRDPKSNFDPSKEPALDDARTSLNLHQLLLLQSRLRHIYPPFFDAASKSHGDCPAGVKWHGLPELNEVEKYDPCTPPGTFESFTRKGAEPPVYDHWRQWFGSEVKPLRSSADRTTSGGLFLQQLLDDRMPSLSFIAVDNPNVIDEADLDRLPAFDPPGLSYDGVFTASLREGFRYQRFSHWGTTYYGNGTSFAAVCNSGSFSNVLLGHFRRHYTHLAMIAHFQHAALLYFADELADTAKMLADRKTEAEFSDEEWRTRIRVIQHRFLKFRTRSYFTEVSNQIQGKDLFAFWFDHLGTAALFDRIAATNSEVYEALETFEARQMTDAQFWLGKIASIGGAVSLGLSVAALVCSVAGLYSNSDREAAGFGGNASVPQWLSFWLTIAAIPAVLVAIAFGVFSWLGLRQSQKSK